MTNEISNADLLKKLEEINSPDERWTVFSRYDERGARSDSLAEHHADIARFQLSADVPKEVVILFETAKNVYLYAWYVYRFYPIAEHQALACLEMGLRKKFPGGLPTGYPNKAKPNTRPTLAPLLRYAIDQGLIKNEGFSGWHSQVRQRARNRVQFEQIESNGQSNSLVQEINLNNIVPNAQDLDYDFVSILEETLPGIRNSYAHGSPRLSNQVLGVFELVSEVLAQLYPRAATFA
ncbi:hypothetical protein ACO0LO_07930 [Undibacterium sp. TJN25]|uniref:hypothetical protein n=1 Tax=Undibacterium sp. TJN25 TaxID=3413056 RepID=UPI003BF32770